MAGDVDDFSDEVEAWHFAALHGFGGELVGIDAAGGDLSFFVSFGSCGSDLPRVQLLFEIVETLIRVRRWRMQFEPALGEAIRQERARATCGRRSGRAFASRMAGVTSCPGARSIANRSARFPVRRDLQDRRTAQAAMRDQHLLAELGMVG